MAKNRVTTSATRRKFLGGAAVAGVATIAMPQVSRAQTVTLKMQGGWGATDILNEYGQDYARIVNEMGGGRLKIDYLNAGAVVKAFSVMDATSSGVLDGTHSVPAYWSGEHRAASLFGTGPCYGTNASQFMGWFYNGGGQDLYNELTQKILGLNVQGFYVFAMPTQPLGRPLEWTEIIIIFVPIFLPLLKTFHIDPLIFGILVALNIQTSFNTPPMAMAAHYLKGLAPPHVKLTEIFAGALPFVFMVFLSMTPVYIFPGTALWLPSKIYH